jgi:hypothetical protein
MTRDASEVMFTSAEQITDDDDDTSIDLYRWRESDDSVTRVSAGTGAVGNTDACNASWIGQCGVQVVPSNNGTPSQPATDNAIAGAAGDVYFYSPEQFSGSDGVPGRQNLYLAGAAGVEYIATLEPGKPITRIQVSSDGEYVAFVTESQLTTADTDGYAAMYRYAKSSFDLRCVSCDPRGLVPTANVKASQNGLFMTEDGRSFFSTASSLVAADSNGVIDIYEYVGGRPQLISTGAAPSDLAPAAEVGLIGVSADGTDVFFSTVETLLAEDQNGSSLKFYNARTGGGFPVSAQIAPCKAADECHAPTDPPVTASLIASAAGLGSSGNVTSHEQCRPLSKRAGALSRKARRARREARSRLLRSSRRAADRRVTRAADRAKRARSKANRCRSNRKVKP